MLDIKSIISSVRDNRSKNLLDSKQEYGTYNDGFFEALSLVEAGIVSSDGTQKPADSFDYYKAPSEEIFQDIKQASIALWSTFDDTYKYATGKIDRIKDLQNISDNYGTMIAMFDRGNQNKLIGYFKRQDTLDLMITLRQWENSEIEKIINKNKDNK